MKTYGVLIVDDSAFMRRAIGLLFENHPQFYVVGIARNGEEALDKMMRFQPDLVTMDVDLPGQSGLDTVKDMKALASIPIVMISEHTAPGSDVSLRALELGAVDFFRKSELIGEGAAHEALNDFFLRITTALSTYAMDAVEAPTDEGDVQQDEEEPPRIDLLVIGCSTGGPSALQSLLPRFATDCRVAVVVVQHMPIGFTKPLAERMNALCSLTVKEAEEGDIVAPGMIYIAPAGLQTLFRRRIQDGRSVVSIKLVEAAAETSTYKPSVDMTLASAVKVYGERVGVVILTGMGSDGLQGCTEVRERGGHVIVESEQTCVVYGMPKVVMDAGLAHTQAPLPLIYRALHSLV